MGEPLNLTPRCSYAYANSNSETNLKIKQASAYTSTLTKPSLVLSLHGSLRSEQPNNSLYTYEGTLDLVTNGGISKQIPLGPDYVLLRGAQLRNTSWLYGLTVFTGHETKLMRNATLVVLYSHSIFISDLLVQCGAYQTNGC